MKQLPSVEAIKKLHEKYAPSAAAYDLVFTHCQIVWEIASQLIDTSHLDVDSAFMQTACLLHDIGVYRLYLPDGEIDHLNYIKHGVLGYELLKAEGFEKQLCRIACCHTGVGLSKQEIVVEELPLPPQDYIAETTEERLVMYADKFHTKSTPPTFMTTASYREHIRKFGEQKVERFNELIAEFGEPNLVTLTEKYDLEII